MNSDRAAAFTLKLLILSFGRFATEQCLNEVCRSKLVKVVRPFTEADEANWKAKRVCNSEHHAPFGSAIELSKHDAREWERFLKFLCLSESVLPVRRINDQQYFVRRASERFFSGLGDLFHFSHQVRLRVQTACRVCEHHIDSRRFGSLDRVEYDAAGVCPVLAAHHFTADSIAPDHQLLHGCGAERVAGGE